jgi:Cu2+-exporting ATPase
MGTIGENLPADVKPASTSHEHGRTARSGLDLHMSHDPRAGYEMHGGQDKHAGHDPEVFRRRFWLTLIVSVPVVFTSEMIMDS